MIEAILAGKDTLCIMPTGGGKSLCFQLPTIAREGVTIVISPLIALMKDQVDSLVGSEIPATFINSSLPPAEQQNRISGMVNGQFKLVYIAPERLRSNAFMRAVQNIQIQLLAVDEAHCISQWGHDFRPDYARLGRFRERLGNPQTVALTATATRLVSDDISKILHLKEPATFVTGFARTNLSLAVSAPNGNAEKDNQLVSFLKSRKGCGIIYASTRKNCEHLVELLADKIGRKITFYHAGLPADARRSVQEKFMAGETEVIVATNAFGMGIDKSDLRFVVHYNLPGSIEAYYQEAGRAGRDGLPSECLMLYSFQDKFIQEFFIDNSYPSKETVKEVYEYLCSIPGDPIETTLQEIKEDLDLSIGTAGIATCENLLEKAGAIERLDSKQNSAAIKIDSDLPTLIDLLPRDARTQRHVMRELERIVSGFRGERVMFQPQRLADRLEMKWEAVNRAIRQLRKIPMIDYIPPFRGRAIHVVDRKQKFSNLKIDFAELHCRQKSEHEKLNSVIRLATTRRCRQLEILEYFGDADRKLCGTCDNCQKRPKLKVGTAKHSDEDACLYSAQVALSGTARTHGRIGKTLIAQMLTGSASKKIKQLSLDRLSTFGLLKGLRQADVVLLMEFLIHQGFITQTETTKYRPVLAISSTGRTLMAGDFSLELTTLMPGDLVDALSLKFQGKIPRRNTPKTTKRITLNEPESNEKTSDSTLESNKPPESLLESKEFKLEAPAKPQPTKQEPAEAFELTEENEKSELAQLDLSKLRIDRPEPHSVQPNFFWTWRLLADGYSMDHLRQVRQIDDETIFNHVLRATENNLPVQAEWLLSNEKIASLNELVEQNPSDRTSKLISKLPAHCLPQELVYFLKCRAAV